MAHLKNATLVLLLCFQVIILSGCEIGTGTGTIVGPKGQQVEVADEQSAALYKVSAGQGMSACAIGSQQELKCWGKNESGKSTIPFDLGRVKQVSVGALHTCAITERDDLRCWGFDGDLQVSGAPIKRFVRIAAGKSHSCGITTENSLECWGHPRFATVEVAIESPREVSVGDEHTCVIDERGMKCWGRIKHLDFEILKSLKNPRHLASGTHHVCVATDEGVRCWGDDYWWQVRAPKDLRNPRQLSAGYMHTCALTDDGVKCWGGNLWGQLDTPKDLEPPIEISVGNSFTCARSKNGIRCWGRNQDGLHAIPQELAAPKKLTPSLIVAEYAKDESGQMLLMTFDEARAFCHEKGLSVPEAVEFAYFVESLEGGKVLRTSDAADQYPMITDRIRGTIYSGPNHEYWQRYDYNFFFKHYEAPEEEIGKHKFWSASAAMKKGSSWLEGAYVFDGPRGRFTFEKVDAQYAVLCRVSR